MPKDEGGLGLIDVVTQGNILAAKWVVRCLEGSSPWQVLMWHRLISAQHVGRVKGQFDLCDIISTPHNFHISGSFIFRSIWTAWRRVAGLVHWKWSGSRSGWDLARRPIWSWKQEGTCISDLPCFQARRLSRNNIFFWRDLWDSNAHSWKTWCSMAREFALSSVDRLPGWRLLGSYPRRRLLR
jgi:hypothetical protein